MNQIKLFVLTILSLFGINSAAYAQECSITLSGTYQFHPQGNDATLYNSFVFDGAGKVDIQSLSHAKGDFFQVGDTVIIYPDRSTFVFLLKDENTLVGISTWVEDLIYKRMENDTVAPPAVIRDPRYASLFYEYYKLTNREAPTLFTYMNINTDTTLRESMERLCDEGLPRACITMANAFMLSSPELLSLLHDPSEVKEKSAPNKEVLNYFAKAIELNELDAIAQLGAYLLLLGHKEEAINIFEKGCELGHAGCCFSLAGIELQPDEE